MRTQFNTKDAPTTEALARMVFRDRHRLARALEFDKQTTEELRAHVADLLDGLDFLIHDSEIWQPLLHVGHIHDIDLYRMQGFTQTTLPRMLRLFGYTHPPPPSIEELQEEVTSAFVRVLTLSEPSPQAVAEARKRLALLAYRIRRQVEVREPWPSGMDRMVVRDAGRKALRLVNSCLPVLVMGAGAAAGALVGGALTAGVGAGLGAVAGAGAASKMIEEGVAVAGRTLIEMVPTWGPKESTKELDVALTPTDPLQTHWVALQLLYKRRTDFYADLFADYNPETDRVEKLADLLVARRHLIRLRDLADDLDLPAAYRSTLLFAVDAVEREYDQTSHEATGLPGREDTGAWLLWVGKAVEELVIPADQDILGSTAEQATAAQGETDAYVRALKVAIESTEESQTRAQEHQQAVAPAEEPAQTGGAIGSVGGWESEESTEEKQHGHRFDSH